MLVFSKAPIRTVFLSKLKLFFLFSFGVLLTLATLRGYYYPNYSNDGLLYMANVLAMRGESVEVIHEAVYREAKAGIPPPIFDHLTGNDSIAPASENDSFRDRATKFTISQSSCRVLRSAQFSQSSSTFCTTGLEFRF